MAKKKEVKMTKADESKFWAFVSYLWLLCLLPLLLKRDDKFAQYHAKQGLVLAIIATAIMMVRMFPIIGRFVSFVGGIFVFILFIIGIVNALTDKTSPLPIIGKFAETLKI